MQYPNPLPSITPELAATVPSYKQDSLPSPEQARVNHVALAALEQIATASSFEQRLKLANTFINTGGEEAAKMLSLRFTELGFAPTKKKGMESMLRISHTYYP